MHLRLPFFFLLNLSFLTFCKLCLSGLVISFDFVKLRLYLQNLLRLQLLQLFLKLQFCFKFLYSLGKVLSICLFIFAQLCVLLLNCKQFFGKGRVLCLGYNQFRFCLFKLLNYVGLQQCFLTNLNNSLPNELTRYAILGQSLTQVVCQNKLGHLACLLMKFRLFFV